MPFKVISTIEKSGVQHFEVFEEQDWISQTDESNKMVNFCRLSELFTDEGLQKGVFPETRYINRAFKKISDLKRVKFSQTEGLLLSDKMGEIGFLNINNVEKLPTKIEGLTDPKPTADGEEEKKEIDDSALPPFEENGVYKTLYGH